MRIAELLPGILFTEWDMVSYMEQEVSPTPVKTDFAADLKYKMLLEAFRVSPRAMYASSDIIRNLFPESLTHAPEWGVVLRLTLMGSGCIWTSLTVSDELATEVMADLKAGTDRFA